MPPLSQVSTEQNSVIPEANPTRILQLLLLPSERSSVPYVQLSGSISGVGAPGDSLEAAHTRPRPSRDGVTRKRVAMSTTTNSHDLSPKPLPGNFFHFTTLLACSFWISVTVCYPWAPK
jgi:hypothetical protein